MSKRSREGGQGTPGAGRIAQAPAYAHTVCNLKVYQGELFARHIGGYQQGLLHQALTVRSRRFLFLDYIKARTTA